MALLVSPLALAQDKAEAPAKSQAEEKSTPNKPSFQSVTVEELQSAVKAGKVAVIDVNGVKSYNKGHVPGAIHFATEKEKLAEKLPEDKSTLVVTYCSGPQ